MHRLIALIAVLGLVGSLLVEVAAPAATALASSGQITERVSVAADGSEGNGGTSRPSVSADGRYVVFTSDASNLVPGDSNGKTDVFVYDRATGAVDRVSVSTVHGLEGNGGSYSASISADGRYVAFDSDASNLVMGDTNGKRDVFVRDRWVGWTQRVSLGSEWNQGSSDSRRPSISADGRYVAFESGRFPGWSYSNYTADIYLRDLEAGTTELVSVTLDGRGGIRLQSEHFR